MARPLDSLHRLRPCEPGNANTGDASVQTRRVVLGERRGRLRPQPGSVAYRPITEPQPSSPDELAAANRSSAQTAAAVERQPQRGSARSIGARAKRNIAHSGCQAAAHSGARPDPRRGADLLGHGSPRRLNGRLCAACCPETPFPSPSKPLALRPENPYRCGQKKIDCRLRIC